MIGCARIVVFTLRVLDTFRRSHRRFTIESDLDSACDTGASAPVGPDLASSGFDAFYLNSRSPLSPNDFHGAGRRPLVSFPFAPFSLRALGRPSRAFKPLPFRFTGGTGALNNGCARGLSARRSDLADHKLSTPLNFNDTFFAALRVRRMLTPRRSVTGVNRAGILVVTKEKLAGLTLALNTFFDSVACVLVVTGCIRLTDARRRYYFYLTFCRTAVTR